MWNIKMKVIVSFQNPGNWKCTHIHSLHNPATSYINQVSLAKPGPCCVLNSDVSESPQTDSCCCAPL